MPDTYPLSLNALVAGCNQKTARDPVLSVERRRGADARSTALKSLSLVFEIERQPRRRATSTTSAARSACRAQSVALLAVLMLRGPQTAAELRANASGCTASPTSRRSRASSTSWRRKPPPKVVQAAARAGRARGALGASAVRRGGGDGVGRGRRAATSGSEIEALRAEQARLAARLDELSALVERIAAELGIDRTA